MLEIKTGEEPKRGASLENPIYAETASNMEVGQYVKTANKATTTGILRALERRGFLGRQHTVNGVLHVWRVK